MTMPLYTLRFEPQFKSMLWGGRRLPEYVRRPAPNDDPVGEAWLLSDVDGSLSVVSNGPLAGRTLRDVIAADPRAMFGETQPESGRFPLLLKVIDARQELSVQVHPNDEQAVRLAGPGSRGKTEAWVVLDADPVRSGIYAGFRPGVTAAQFSRALVEKTVPRTLHSFTPMAGDCVFLEAGTIHAIGANVLLFEVQQTSDITYRLYDWDRVDAKTKKPRQLHIEAGLACANFERGPCDPVIPKREGDRESLVECDYFTLRRFTSFQPVVVGTAGACTAMYCVDGRGTLAGETLQAGDAVLLPAVLGEVTIVPEGSMTLLECGIGAKC